MSHTPGPWQVQRRDMSIRDSKNRPVAGAIAHDGTDVSRQAEDNANLIAAAPELLEALKVARKWMTEPREREPNYIFREHDEAVEFVDAAIAKAEGKS